MPAAEAGVHHPRGLNARKLMSNPSPQPAQAAGPLVELRQVHKSFQEGLSERRVLDGVDLSIGAGETVALVGRSGSGKSTLLHLISGIDLPDQGSVHLSDERVSSLSSEQRTRLRRRSIGFVFQFFNLIPTLNVEENVLLPMELAGRLDGESRDRAREALEQMGLADRLGAFPDVLSGGEQ